jgi:hypothetical protein
MARLMARYPILRSIRSSTRKHLAKSKTYANYRMTTVVLQHHYHLERKGKEVEMDVKNSNRGTRLPADFVLPEDWIGFCQQYRPDLNPHKVFDEFKDYWTALPSGKGTKTDWTATWRNWVRRQNAPKQDAVSKRQETMNQLTRGMATPKPFWQKPDNVIEVQDVERKRLL